MNTSKTITLDSIYGTFYEQLEVIGTIEKIYDIRTAMKKDIQLGVGAHGCAMGRLAS